ncbi:hypothetical protein, partial [Klebsiella pneumoniae]|uniref:hypothetical protein n=1 Tax=Klebsiella pneumoniae TaxID=573 RepID=UPI001C6E61A3
LKMPAFEWVHVQLHQQKGMISLSPPTICNSANIIATIITAKTVIAIPAINFTLTSASLSLAPVLSVLAIIFEGVVMIPTC